MSSSNLSDLAPEILILIFGHCGSFSAAAAFSSTSRIFREVWITNLTSICTILLSHRVECLEFASQLVKTQQRIRNQDHSLNKEDLLIDHTQRALRNGKQAGDAVSRFEYHIRTKKDYTIPADASGQRITPDRRYMLSLQERHDFLKAFYRVMITMTLLSKDINSPVDSVCSDWPMLDFEQVLIVMRFGWRHNSMEARISLEFYGFKAWVWAEASMKLRHIHGQMRRRVYGHALLRETYVSRDFHVLDPFYKINHQGRGRLVGEILKDSVAI